MKNTFDFHAQESEEDIKKFWQEGIFIFDTNVLLSLYRYKKETAEKLFEVIGNLKERIWIPYHVGMEFHKNRLTIIADQTAKFSTVKNAINKIRTTSRSSIEELKIKKRHSLINIEDFSEKIENLLNDFDKELGSLQEKQQSVTEKDPILDRIHSLFDGRIGAAPDQDKINKIYEEGVVRYKYKRPPGYKDVEKGEKDADIYYHAGILYKGRYGDLVAWNQIIEYSKDKKIETVIFITDDGKEDWWLQIDSMGKKTIGPRLELVHEIRKEAGVKKFLMYQPEQFLSHANDYLNAKISENEINEVREVTLEQKKSKDDFKHKISKNWDKVNGALYEIEKIYTEIIVNNDGGIIYKKNTSDEPFIVTAIHFEKIKDIKIKIYDLINTMDVEIAFSDIFTRGHLFFSFENVSDAFEAIKIVQKISIDILNPITVTIGLADDADGAVKFHNMSEFTYEK